MNKYKRNITAMRSYLKKDAKGLELLGAIARDNTSQRKKIAELTEMLSQKTLLAEQSLKRAVDAESLALSIKRDVEREVARNKALKNREAIYTKKIRELNQKDAIETEELSKSSSSALKVKRLLKEVQHHFKKAPRPTSGYKLLLEDIVVNHTRDEYMKLGMLVAALALHNFPAGVEAKTVFHKMNGWTEDDTRPFVRWARRWIFISEESKALTEKERIALPSYHAVTR